MNVRMKISKREDKVKRIEVLNQDKVMLKKKSKNVYKQNPQAYLNLHIVQKSNLFFKHQTHTFGCIYTRQSLSRSATHTHTQMRMRTDR